MYTVSKHIPRSKAGALRHASLRLKTPLVVAGGTS